MSAYEHYETPAEFEAGYANSITPEVVAHWERIFRRDSDEALARLPCRQNLTYGPHERNRIDFFPSHGEGSPAPTLLAIHGGLWLLFDKWMMHFLAEAFTSAGYHVAAINYPLAPEHSLSAIVEDCRAAAAWIHRNASDLGIDRERLSVVGHSAAGQLCSAVAATDWSSFNLPVGMIRSCIGVSGFYDIEPFFRTGFQDLVRFSEDDFRRWNPMRCVTASSPAHLLITGARESSLLQQMMGNYADRLRTLGVPAQTVLAPDECHFSVLHQLGNPASAVFKAALAFLGDNLPVSQFHA